MSSGFFVDLSTVAAMAVGVAKVIKASTFQLVVQAWVAIVGLLLLADSLHSQLFSPVSILKEREDVLVRLSMVVLEPEL